MGEPGTAVELPSYLQIEPVGQCNLRCQMCPIQFRRDGPPYGPVAFMPLEHFVRVLEQFPGLRELHLQGMGEPMMHPRLFDMIEYAATKGICVSTNTNLTLLSRRRAERCVTSGLARLHVSLDGATAETYEKIRIRARFQRVIGNLELLLETRRRLKSDRPHLHLVMVIMRQNLQELPSWFGSPTGGRSRKSLCSISATILLSRACRTNTVRCGSSCRRRRSWRCRRSGSSVTLARLAAWQGN